MTEREKKTSKKKTPLEESLTKLSAQRATALANNDQKTAKKIAEIIEFLEKKSGKKNVKK